MKYYAGIGSRQTPLNICDIMAKIGDQLNNQGYTLRSGGAKGADSAFEKWATNKEIFYAQNATEESIEVASKFHPAWDKCNDYARKLHGRNAMIILGKDLKTPVEFVICWTPAGNMVGGTALGMRIAQDRQIKIYNLAVNDDLQFIVYGNIQLKFNSEDIWNF